jgi:pimeloyl-ACP methyl ester carboxylesterase
MADGPPVALIAGTAQPRTTFELSPVPLLRDEYQVLVFDHCGVGLSDSRQEDYSTRMFAEDAAGLLDHLGWKEAHLLGHSMGGRVLQWLALDRPDLVRSLVFAATGPGVVRPEAEYERGIPLKMAQRLGEIGWHAYRYEAFVTNFFTEQFAEEHPERINELVGAFWAGPAPSLEDALKHVAGRQRHQAAEHIHEIAQPALVVDGELDKGWGHTGTSHVEQSEWMHANLPNSEFHLIPDVSHGFFWQAPEASVSVLKDFWRRH